MDFCQVKETNPDLLVLAMSESEVQEAFKETRCRGCRPHVVQMKIVRSRDHKPGWRIALAVFAVVLLWPSVPLRGIDLWLQFLALLFPTVILYPILAFLIASYAAIYYYNKRVEVCCSISSAKAGASASFAGVLLAACPACIPVVGFFLPLSVTITLSYYSWFFAMGLRFSLLFAVYRMGGFKKL